MQKAADIAPLIESAVDRLTWSRGLITMLLKDLTDAQLLHQAGGSGNHALWIMGHLAVSEEQIRCTFTAQQPQIPGGFLELFGAQTTPESDASRYPARSELLNAMEASRTRTIAWLKAMTPETARIPSPEDFRMFAPDAITAAFGMMGHEMIHAGQILTIRADLGIPRLFS